MRDTAGAVYPEVRPCGRIVPGDVGRLAGRGSELWLSPIPVGLPFRLASAVTPEPARTHHGGALHPDPEVVEVGQLGHACVQALDEDDAADRQLA